MSPVSSSVENTLNNVIYTDDYVREISAYKYTSITKMPVLW
jgi:hypothetical protein